MRGRRALAAAGLVLGGALAAGLLAEAALRLLPVPGVRRFSYRYDPLVGYALYPGSLVIWRGAGGGEVVRRTNALGFLDREPVPRRDPGSLRVGFFGDSYVEARQVPLADTFFRRLEREVPGVETVAFGRSGFGTLGAYLLARRYAAAADLDLAVYVFCENDPGDNLRAVRRDPHFAYAEEDGDGFRVLPPEAGEPGVTRRAVQAALRRSVLLATVAERVRLLVARGVRVRPEAGARAMATRRAAGGETDQNQLPSTWPPELRARAVRVTRAILRRWRDEEAAAGRRFAVLYVPRETELGKEAPDSWQPWLEPYCRAEGIPFVDPAPELLALTRAGIPAWGDHLSRAGHEAFGAALRRWLEAEGLTRPAGS